ncbi:type II secretion system minor pseudopilin GspH [Marinobacter xestospongiae]|uniref:type II secretion system minor pseudopilin GspH n=1 Tax=Marinobacter xestospongiae TaxID=994319 RepID=UPI003743C4FA
MVRTLPGQSAEPSGAKLTVSRPACARGFTMIEILVVLVVVGLLAALAIVNLGGGSQLRELKNEVQELYLLMQTASEQAVLNNQELGLVMEEEGYRFVLYDDLNGEWVGQPERLFRPRQWPEWLVATLQAEGDAPRLASDEDKLRPDLVFFSSGETTPFEAEFTLGSDTDHRHRIESDGLNGLDWRAPGDEDEL